MAVLFDGEVIAGTDRRVAVFKTGLPVRWYLPQGEVRHEHLEATDTMTVCLYEGIASYWSVHAGAHSFDDACWT